LQNAGGNFGSKFRSTRFHVEAGSGQFPGDALFGRGDVGEEFGTSFFQNGSAFIEQFFAGDFLLGVDLIAGLFQRFLILLDFSDARTVRLQRLLRAMDRASRSAITASNGLKNSDLRMK
jgi:hypothetical protein